MWMLTLKARPFYPLMFQWPTWESSTQSIAQARKNQHEKRWMRALNNGKALSNSNSLSSGKKKGDINEHCPLYFERLMNMWALLSVPSGGEAVLWGGGCPGTRVPLRWKVCSRCWITPFMQSDTNATFCWLCSWYKSQTHRCVVC